MKRIKLIKAFVIGWLTIAPSAAEVYRVTDLSGGLNDSVPAHLIADNEASKLENFHVNKLTLGLDQREGTSRLNATQLSGSAEVDVFTYAQQDGDEYLLAFASKTVAYSSDNGSTWTTLISTGVDGAYWDCTGFIDDKEYCVTQSTSAFSFNGTIHTVTTQTPAGKYIEAYQNRLWVANTVANPGRLSFSDLLLGSTWTSTGYIDLTDEAITGIGKPYDGGLPVYTDNQTWIIRGDDPTNFYPQQISQTIGLSNNRAVKNFRLREREYQILLSKGQNQSQNNLYALDGIGLQPLGNNILNTLAAINIGNSSVRSREWDTQSDFTAGTFSDTTGTYTSGRVILSTADTNISNNEFESGSDTNMTNWVEHRGSINRDASLIDITPQSGAYFMSDYAPCYNCTIVARNVRYWVREVGGSELYSEAFATGASWTKRTIQLSSFRGRYITVTFGVNLSLGNPSNDSVIESITSDPFYCSGVNMTYYDQTDSDTQIVAWAVDTVEKGKTTTASGTYTSEQYQADSNLSEWGKINFDYTLGGGSMTFFVKTATGSSALTDASFATISNDQTISTTTNKFFQYRVSFASGTSTNFTTAPKLDKVVANWTSSSGASQQPDMEVFEGNLLLSYPGSDQDRNQSVLEMNEDGAFSTLSYGTTGYYGLTVSRGRLFAGDSSTETSGGYVWELETGTLDHGVPVVALATLKHQEFSPLDDYQKSLIAAYFNYQVLAGTFTVTILENFSEYSNSYTVQFGSGTAYNRWKLEPLQQTTAKQLGLQFSNEYPGSRLKLYPPVTYHFEKARLIPQ